MRLDTFSRTVASFLLLVSCVSDDSPVRPSNIPTGGSSDAGTSKEDGGVPVVDASVQCMASEKNCGGTCADTLVASEHCGVCGNSCGGGTCNGGVCGPMVVRADIPAFGGYALGEGKVFFTSDVKVNACDEGMCKGPPKQLADMVTHPAFGIEFDSGYIAFEGAPNQSTQRPTLYHCPTTGCTNPPQAVMADGLNGIAGFRLVNKTVYGLLNGTGLRAADCTSGVCQTAVTKVAKPVGSFAMDDTTIFFDDPSTGNTLKTCPLNASPCLVRADLSSFAVMGDIVLAQNQVFFIGAGATAGGNGVYVCPKTSCGTPGVVAKLLTSIRSLAADDKGIYWATDDKISMCADFACAGGIRTVLTVAGSTRLRLTPKYVYYTVPGDSDAGIGSTTIMRIARPQAL